MLHLLDDFVVITSFSLFLFCYSLPFSCSLNYIYFKAELYEVLHVRPSIWRIWNITPCYRFLWYMYLLVEFDNFYVLVGYLVCICLNFDFWTNMNSLLVLFKQRGGVGDCFPLSICHSIITWNHHLHLLRAMVPLAPFPIILMPDLHLNYISYFLKLQLLNFFNNNFLASHGYLGLGSATYPIIVSCNWCYG